MEDTMPIYEYQCPKCERFFEKIQSIAEGGKPVACPYCGAEKADRVLSRFSSSKGEGAPSSCGGASQRFS
jgi:putative FmdB family regulatory protein